MSPRTATQLRWNAQEEVLGALQERCFQLLDIHSFSKLEHHLGDFLECSTFNNVPISLCINLQGTPS